MISCNGLKYKDKATKKLTFTTSDEKIKAAQLLGSDPRIMEKMARSDYLAPFDIIDINIDDCEITGF
jgi:tRNA-dihydrouridine synthase